MTDAVLIDLAVKADPAIEVVFIDTGYHFPETLETVETVRRRYGLNMKIMTAPENTDELWKTDPDNCCSALKVQQLERALAGKAAWMSGLRRNEADTRSSALVVGRDLRGLVKINPIATWTDSRRRDLHRRPRRPGQSAPDAGLSVDRLHALHPARRRRRRPSGRALERPRQDRVRDPPQLGIRRAPTSRRPDRAAGSTVDRHPEIHR